MNALTDHVTEHDVTPLWSCIDARGTDASTFLQGQLSQDLEAVTSEGASSLLLAPDGIVITSLIVVSTPDGYQLTLPRPLGEVALSRLRRFLLRTACTLELREIEHGPYDTVDEQIDARRPGPAEFARALTPQCFGASFVTASVSFTKGCFTGQELVGRLDARSSSVPWRMARCSGPDAARIDEVLTSKGPAGTSGLTTSVQRGGSVVGLGFAHRSLFGSDELIEATDVSVEEIA
jgi:folate-binding Fe-S cluster repair protein YgfZ